MPDCIGMQDKCQCHRTYTSFKDEAGEHQRRCLKLFSEKKSWDKAVQTCANEFSALVDGRISDSLLEGFRNEREFFMELVTQNLPYLCCRQNIRSRDFSRISLFPPSRVRKTRLWNGPYACDVTSADT
ncbi:hypothetical protein AVEN_241592-1 [Araneus ventricosus]|uniref:C-type lectin domain-containing protein n=1 Tax=Araneus ventricosus TaxID=182803 RepID=A0A4Y2H4J1_ARAVE|nr:hypothetical protein AVEN_241592-1 [Araneus ventricosus]